MEAAHLSALAALAGSVIGGLTSGFTTWLNQRAVDKAGYRAQQFKRLEDLFREFITAASKTYGEALISNEPRIEEIVALYAMISEMRLLCSTSTVTNAEKIMYMTLETYFSTSKTVKELHELVKGGGNIDPLKDFAEAAREELRLLKSS